MKKVHGNLKAIHFQIHKKKTSYFSTCWGNNRKVVCCVEQIGTNKLIIINLTQIEGLYLAA